MLMLELIFNEFNRSRKMKEYNQTDQNKNINLILDIVMNIFWFSKYIDVKPLMFVNKYLNALAVPLIKVKNETFTIERVLTKKAVDYLKDDSGEEFLQYIEELVRKTSNGLRHLESLPEGERDFLKALEKKGGIEPSIRIDQLQELIKTRPFLENIRVKFSAQSFRYGRYLEVLEDLEHLETLSLEGVVVGGEFASDYEKISQLKNLKSLHISTREPILSQPFPKPDGLRVLSLQPLAKLDKLRVLNLHCDTLCSSGTGEITNTLKTSFPCLHTLKLEFERDESDVFSAIVNALSELPQVTTVHLVTPVMWRLALASLNNLKHVKSLLLDYRSLLSPRVVLKDLSCISKLEQLEELQLGLHHIVNLEPLLHLTRLKKLVFLSEITPNIEAAMNDSTEFQKILESFRSKLDYSPPHSAPDFWELINERFLKFFGGQNIFVDDNALQILAELKKENSDLEIAGLTQEQENTLNELLENDRSFTV